MIRKLLRYITRYPRVTLGVNLVLLIFCIMQLPRVQIMNSVDNFLLDDSDKRYHEELKKEFKNNEFFLIAMESDDIFTRENLALIKTLSDELQDIQGVRDVRSLSTVDYIVGEDEYFTIRRFYKDPSTFEQDKLTHLRKEALAEKFYVPALVSRDGKTAGIAGFVTDDPNNDSHRKEILKKVDEVLARNTSDGTTFHLLGWTKTDVTLGEMMIANIMVLFPVCFTIMILCVLAFFRNWRIVLTVAACMLASTLATLCAFAITGFAIDNLTGAVLPLCLSMALVDIVHLILRLNPELLLKHGEKSRAMQEALSSIFSPCLFTSITTGVGFLSLLSCGLDSMSNFAYISALSMLFEFFFTFTLAPSLFLLLSPPEKVFTVRTDEHRSRLSGWLKRWSGLVKRNASPILMGSLLLVAVGVWQIFRIPVETDLTTYLRPDNPLRKAIAFAEPQLGGTTTFDISFRTQGIDGFKKPDNLAYIARLQSFVESQHEVSTAHTLVDMLKEMNMSFHSEDSTYYRLPESQDQIEQYLLLYDGNDLSDFVNADFNHTRMVVRISIHNMRNQKALLQRIREWIHTHAPPSSVMVRLTGHAVNNVNTAQTLVDGQIKSFGLAIVLVGALLALSFRSLSWGLFSLIPNIIPILITFGVMGIFQIPLDTGTVMVASISLGIACDDTLHFIVFYRDRLLRGDGVPQAVEKTIIKKGAAILLSSVVLGLGFAVLYWSSFVPIVYFGLLCTVTMGAALLADLMVLPAILHRSSLRRSK